MSSAFLELGPLYVAKFFLYTVLNLFYSVLTFPPLRKQFLQLCGSSIEKGTVIMNVKFFNWHRKGPKGIVIGKDCFIGDETLIDLYGPVIIGNQVTIAQRVTILTHLNVGYKNHPLQKYFPKTINGVTLKNGSVIGAASVVLPGIIIGENSFVAAGSVVTKNVPPSTLVAGVPAKEIRKLK